MPQPPTLQSPTSSRKQAEGAVLISSLVVVSLWAYRKLIEPVTVNPKSTEPALRKIIGLEPTPATSAQFAVGFGFVFFTLSITAVAAPELATAFAILVAVGYTLTNGASVFSDITSQVSKQTTTTVHGGEPQQTDAPHTVAPQVHR
jgi:hypothetical protein